MRVSIITTECRRCGKPVAIVVNSEAYERYSGICSNCITPEELREVYYEGRKVGEVVRDGWKTQAHKAVRWVECCGKPMKEVKK